LVGLGMGIDHGDMSPKQLDKEYYYTTTGLVRCSAYRPCRRFHGSVSYAIEQCGAIIRQCLVKYSKFNGEAVSRAVPAFKY